jgi:hypothetical protein
LIDQLIDLSVHRADLPLKSHVLVCCLPISKVLVEGDYFGNSGDNLIMAPFVRGLGKINGSDGKLIQRRGFDLCQNAPFFQGQYAVNKHKESRIEKRHEVAYVYIILDRKDI